MSHGKGVNKSIKVISRIGDGGVSSLFSVTDHKIEVARTTSLEVAVNIFNDIK